MDPLGDLKALTDVQQHEIGWKMDCSLGTERSVDNQIRYDPEEDLGRCHSPSVNNDPESRSYADESEKGCKTSTVGLNPSSPGQDVPPEFEKVFVKVEDVLASDEEPVEQKFWIEEPSVCQEPQPGCSSWSDEVDHQRGRDLDSTKVNSKGSSHQYIELSEDRARDCRSPVVNHPEVAVYCVGSEEDGKTSMPCSNTITSSNTLTIDEAYACGFEQNEYLSIPVEVLYNETQTSRNEQVDKEMLVASHSKQTITQNSTKNRLTMENYVCDSETPILKGHMMRKHSDENQFHCKFCDYKCSRSSSLKIHERIHTGEKPYSCKFCDYKCSESNSLKVHERVHTGEKPYSCKFCDYKCSQRAHLKVHLRTHTGEKPFHCKFCFYTCATSAGLKEHERKHTGEKQFHCKFCDFKCCTPYHLKEHEKTHTGEKPHHCKLCDYKCSRSSNLKVHERTHTGEHPLHCEFCEYKCSTFSRLKVHERKHTGEKPYHCEFCVFQCSSSSQLKTHKRKHTGEKPFHCKFCIYKCATSAHLKVHERKHTGEKPYHCEFCDFKCAQLQGLKVHERTHTGNKPFNCKFCDFKCSQYAALQVHQRAHTGENPFN